VGLVEGQEERLGQVGAAGVEDEFVGAVAEGLEVAAGVGGEVGGVKQDEVVQADAEGVRLAGGVGRRLARVAEDGAEALKLYRPAASRGNVIAMHYMARRLSLPGGDFDEALKWAQGALKGEPRNARYAAVLARVLFRRGEQKNALRILEKVVEASGRDSELRDWLGDVHAALGQDNAARTQWLIALDMGIDRRADPYWDPAAVRRKLGQ